MLIPVAISVVTVAVAVGSSPPAPPPDVPQSWAVVTLISKLSTRALLEPVFEMVIENVSKSELLVIVQDFCEPDIVMPVVLDVTENVVLLDKKDKLITLAPPVGILLTVNEPLFDIFWI